MRFLKMLFYGTLVLIALALILKKRGKVQVNVDDDVVEVEHVISLDEFNKIDVDGAFEVILIQGDEPGLRVLSDGNTESLRREVVDDVLRIHQDFKIGAHHKIKLEITAAELEEIKLDGAVSIKSKNPIQGEEITLDFDGAAQGDLELEAEQIRLNLSGAADLDLKGYADQATMRIDGASNIDAFDFATHELKVSVYGVGDADVYADERLEVKITGAGNVTYQGDPDHVSRHISGLGSVKKD